MLDDNTDGVVTLDEFLGNLKNPYEKRKDYQRLMGDIKVDNPIVLEERMLDMRFRKPHIKKEIKHFHKKLLALKKSYSIVFKRLNHYKNLTKIPRPGKKKTESELRREIAEMRKKISFQIVKTE